LVAATIRYPAATAKLRALLDRHGVAIITVLLLILLAWLLAKWTWLFLQQREVINPSAPIAQIDINAATERVVGAHPFGVAGERAATEEAQVSTLNLRLKGVFAFTLDSPAFAIINTGAKNDEAFKVGDEIVPGVVLNEVQPTHILIKRGGALEKVNLEERPGGSGGAAPPPIPSRPPISGRPTSPLPPSSGNYNLSRGEVNAQMRDTKQMANLGRVAPSPGGGVMIEDLPPSSLAEKMGLQIGDVIRTVNGNAVNSPADLARLYQQLGQTAQVRIEGTRGGHPLNLNYNVQQ